jgi:hypothetical protein
MIEAFQLADEDRRSVVSVRTCSLCGRNLAVTPEVYAAKNPVQCKQFRGTCGEHIPNFWRQIDSMARGRG